VLLQLWQEEIKYILNFCYYFELVN
jgi:hypothetical protein